MAHATEPAVGTWTAADLMERFGAIPLHRIRHDPAPGTATERDVIEIHDREDRLYELIDAGVRLVWYVYHTPRREVHVYTAPHERTVLAEGQMLDARDVLPGLTLPVSNLFAELGLAQRTSHETPFVPQGRATPDAGYSSPVRHLGRGRPSRPS